MLGGCLRRGISDYKWRVEKDECFLDQQELSLAGGEKFLPLYSEFEIRKGYNKGHFSWVNPRSRVVQLISPCDQRVIINNDSRTFRKAKLMHYSDHNKSK